MFKIKIRLIVSLIFAATLVATLFTLWQVLTENERLRLDVTHRANLVAEGVCESLLGFDWESNPVRLVDLTRKFSNRDRLMGIVIFDKQGKIRSFSPQVEGLVDEAGMRIPKVFRNNLVFSEFFKIRERRFFIFMKDITGGDSDNRGVLGLFYDIRYIAVRLGSIWRTNFFRLLIQSLCIALISILVIQWSIAGPIARLAEWLKGVRTESAPSSEKLPHGDVLNPLVTEVTRLVESLSSAREVAAEEARLRLEGESLWTAERLQVYLKQELKEKSLFVMSNREPYMHVRHGKQIECIVPAGGLVTALDPILKACGGMWIAHGSGDADSETADREGKLSVPPDESLYTLKRVWMNKVEEAGYYFGFANEGLWPLCHITHTRPIFRLDDWIHYQKVNERFAKSLLTEISGEKSPLILVQDYHLALVPRLIKNRRPDARVAIFWHIPWANPEVFEICPWKKEILFGLLGADLVGFHTQFHCNNFLQTIDRILESKINWDDFSVQRKGEITLVRPFPISVAMKTIQPDRESTPVRVTSIREKIFKDYFINAEFLGVGVDRIDYTKGIIERLRAIECLLETHPAYIGKLTFIQLAAPSRTHIKRYHDLIGEIEELVEQINWRYQKKNWRPILFLKSHHRHEDIVPFFRAAHFCMVTSLHDGMNLVAKEFVASRDDGDGVLILSQFTGAARELRDALIVNPYNIEEMAEAVHRTLTMDASERRERMGNMREVVRERNIYRWAANLVTALSRIRLSPDADVKSKDSAS